MGFNRRNKRKLTACSRGAVWRVGTLDGFLPELVLNPHSRAGADFVGVKMNGHILCVLASLLPPFFSSISLLGCVFVL